MGMRVRSVKENQIAAIGPGMFAGLISLIMLYVCWDPANALRVLMRSTAQGLDGQPD